MAVAFALSSTSAISAAASDPTDEQITRLQTRVHEQPRDFIALARLGQLFISQVRRTGNLSLYANAEQAFLAAFAEFPDDPGALSGLGAVRMALHRFSEARELAGKILRRDSASIEGRLLLGDAELALGHTEVADGIFRALPESPASFARLAELASLRGDNEEALRLMLRAADESEARADAPESIAWFHVRAGEMLFRVGKFGAAREQYDVACRHFDGYHTAEHVAELRAAEEKFDDAIARYEPLIAQSERPDLQQTLGDLYVFMRKPEQAKPWHKKALAGYLASVARGEVHFIHHLAGFYADVREDGAEAVKWARSDLELRQTPGAHEALAWALYRAGNFAESREQIDAALASGIRDAHIFYHAGLIISAAGDIERGQKFLRETTVLNPRYGNFHVHR